MKLSGYSQNSIILHTATSTKCMVLYTNFCQIHFNLRLSLSSGIYIYMCVCFFFSATMPKPLDVWRYCNELVRSVCSEEDLNLANLSMSKQLVLFVHQRIVDQVKAFLSSNPANVVICDTLLLKTLTARECCKQCSLFSSIDQSLKRQVCCYPLLLSNGGFTSSHFGF